MFIAAALIYVARRPQVLLQPEFRGEDGQIFYLGTYFLSPLASLFTPWAGFLHVVPRAVALLERLVPVAAAPLVGNLAAVLIVAAVATYVATRLDVEPPIRLALAGLVLVLPGVTETHGQIAWIPWYLAAFLVAVPLSRRPGSQVGRWVEVGAVLVAGLGAPLIIVIAPIYLVARRRLLAAASLGALAQVAVALTNPRLPPASTAGDVLPFVAIRGIAEPFLGGRIITSEHLEGRLLLACAVGALVLLGVRRAPRRWLLLAAYTWAATLLAVLLKTGDPLAILADGEAGNRYFFLPGLAITGLVVAVAIRQRTPAAVALCALLSLGIVADFGIEPHPYLDWADRSACVGGPTPCVVPVYPEQLYSLRWPGPHGSYDPGPMTGVP